MKEIPVFDVLNKSVIKDEKWINADYHPPELLHRKKEIEEIASDIGIPIKSNYYPRNILVFGSPSQGKTAVVKKIHRSLNDWIKRDSLPVESYYMRCKDMESLTNLAVVNTFLTEMKMPIKMGLPEYHIWNVFLDEIEKREKTFILIIDDIHLLNERRRESLLNTLSRANQTLKKSKICFVAVTNDHRLIGKLRGETRSALNYNTILFKSYNTQEIYDILRYRAGKAFAKGSITQGAIEMTTKKTVTHSKSDIRKGLLILNQAGKMADESKQSIIDENMIEKAYEKTENEVILNALRGVGTRTHVILGSIYYIIEQRKDNSLLTGDVISFVLGILKGDLTPSRISQHITEIEKEKHLIDVQRANTKGNTRRIRPLESVENIKFILNESIDSLCTLLNDGGDANNFLAWIKG